MILCLVMMIGGMVLRYGRPVLRKEGSNYRPSTEMSGNLCRSCFEGMPAGLGISAHLPFGTVYYITLKRSSSDTRQALNRVTGKDFYTACRLLPSGVAIREGWPATNLYRFCGPLLDSDPHVGKHCSKQQCHSDISL